MAGVTTCLTPRKQGLVVWCGERTFHLLQGAKVTLFLALLRHLPSLSPLELSSSRAAVRMPPGPVVCAILRVEEWGAQWWRWGEKKKRWLNGQVFKYKYFASLIFSVSVEAQRG